MKLRRNEGKVDYLFFVAGPRACAEVSPGKNEGGVSGMVSEGCPGQSWRWASRLIKPKCGERG